MLKKIKPNFILALLVAVCGIVAAPHEAHAAPETVNTFDYMINRQGGSLTGQHPLSQTVIGNDIYYVKGRTDGYENYRYDQNYTYLVEDHSGDGTNGTYSFSNGKWMKPTMQVGERILSYDNYMQRATFGNPGNTCLPVSFGYFPYSTTLLSRNPTFNHGGTLGRQDTIILQYDYRVGGSGTDFERMYYAKNRGLVKWELYRNNQVIQVSAFNQISSDPPVPPDTASACKGMVHEPQAPTVPGSINELVNTFYEWILKRPADPEGFASWSDHLQKGDVSIKDMYRQFFNAQNIELSLTNEEFGRNLYATVLFREVDQTSLTSVANALNSGVTRSAMLDGMLQSEEFNTRIMPKLQLVNVNAPPLPYNVSTFVTMLYSCVLNNSEPDGPGFTSRVKNIQNGTTTIKRSYTDFFAAQSTLNLSNEQFSHKLYGCILFRPIDPGAYNAITTGLANGSLQRSQLVQSLLASSEFNNNILPALRALK